MHHSYEQLVDANITPEDEELHIEKITGDKLLCPLTKVRPLKNISLLSFVKLIFGACGHFFTLCIWDYSMACFPMMQYLSIQR